MDTFMGRAYWYNTQCMVFCPLFVHRDAFGVHSCVVDTPNGVSRLRFAVLPMHENADLVQRALDLFAQRHHLESCERVCGTCALFSGDLEKPICRLDCVGRMFMDRCAQWTSATNHAAKPPMTLSNDAGIPANG